MDHPRDAKVLKLQTNFYDRTKFFTPCKITEAEAVAMFKLYYDKTYHCQELKIATPFYCKRSLQRPLIECFSLAYANALLLYSVFSTICEKVFAARKEPVEDRTSEAHVRP